MKRGERHLSQGAAPLNHPKELPQDKNATTLPGGEQVSNLSTPVSSPGDAVQYGVARRNPRAKCFLAVELRPEGEGQLVLGSLSEVSIGGCCVETSTLLSEGTGVAISPLEANGLLWVKGVARNARVADGMGNFKIGIKFMEGDPVPSHSLLEFLRFVEESRAKERPDDSSYLRRLTGH
jgi:hypothetical protein